MRTGKLELYNLKSDIGEQSDLSSVYPERVKELAAELSSKLRGWNSPMPRLRETGKSVPLPDELL